MGRPGMSARWNPTASGPGAAGGGAAGGGGGGAGVYTEKTFTYTGGPQTFNLADTNGQPIQAYLFGPGGGAEGDTNTRGGAGGYTTGIINIPGNSGQLKIIVGGHGGPGQQNNGSGAGYTGIFTSDWQGNSVSTDHGASILLAGGGGGSANSSSGSSHGGGAGGGSSGQRGNPSNSGGLPGTQSGGGQYRQTGGGYCSSGDQCYGQSLRGGVACGGGEGSGGVGWPNQIYGGRYASAAGGNGCNAGGGGAGYYGGAGGASSPNGGNGGGGSGYIGGHPSYPVESAATYVGNGETPPAEGRNSPFYSGQISWGGRHSHNRGNGSHQGGSGKVVITYLAPGSGGGAPTGPVGIYGRITQLNNALAGAGYSYNNYQSIINKIQEYNFMVIGTPRYGGLAESMQAQNPPTTDGRFYRSEFDSGSTIENSSGFENDTYNGFPYIGFVGYKDSEYFGVASMMYRDYNSRSLAGLFYPSQYRNLYTHVLNANGTTRDEGSTSARTHYSNNQQPNSNGYYQSNRFAADDGVWGFNMVGSVDGNSPGPYLSANNSYSYGCENANSGDTSGTSQRFYWGGQYNTTSYCFFFFRGTA